MTGAPTQDGHAPAWPGSILRLSIRDVVLSTLVVLTIGACFWAVFRFHYAVFMLICAALIRIAIKPAVHRLQGLGFRPNISVAIVFSVLGIVLLACVALVAPFMLEQTGTLIGRLPTYYFDLRQLLLESASSQLQRIGNMLPETLASVLPRWQTDAGTQVAMNSMSPVAAFVSDIAYGVFLLVATLMMSLYWSLDADRVTGALFMRIASDKRDAWRALVKELEAKVGDYFRGQAILCGAIFTLSTAAFMLIGLPYALVLGLIAGVTEAIPMIGPLLGMIPALLIALAIAPDQAIWVVLSAIVIQQFENNFLVPRVMGKSVGINPIISILAISMFSLIFGWVGALLAIPVAAMLQILIGRFLQSNEIQDVAAHMANVEASASRSKLGLLRLDAHELAADVRSQPPDNPAGAGENADSAGLLQDQLEAIMNDLEAMLAAADVPQSRPGLGDTP